MKLRLLFFLLLISFSQNSFSQSWQWAKRGCDPLNPSNNAIGTDKYGNVFIAGVYTSHFDVGSSNLTHVPSSSADAYLVKYDSLGNVLWTIQNTGRGNSAVFDMYIDSTGNSYICGYYDDSLVIGGQNLRTIFLPINIYAEAGFIAKIDPSGNVIWAKKINTSEHSTVHVITADQNGNIYCAGAFTDSVFIAQDTLFRRGTGNYDYYIAKFDTAGNAIWAKSIYGNSGQYGGAFYFTSAVTNNYGKVFFSGNFRDTFYFATDTLIHWFLTSSQAYAGFIVSYDSSGTFNWSRKIGAHYVSSRVNGITSDATGNIYATGLFSATANFDTISVTINPLTSYNMFLAKFLSSGSCLWVAKPMGSSNTLATGLCEDGHGNIYTTGQYSVNPIFGPSTLPYDNLALTNSFVAKFDSSGNAKWGTNTYGYDSDLDHDYTVATDAISMNSHFPFCFVSGHFDEKAFFGSTILTSCASDQNNIFTARLDTTYIPVITTVSNNKTDQIKFSVYPNPFQDYLIVETEEPAILIIYNATGQLCEQKSLAQGKTTITLHSFSSGLYFYRLLSNGKEIGTGKLISE